jgi:hypothetical protein
MPTPMAGQLFRTWAKKDASRWQEVLADLDQLKSASLLPLAAVNPAR